MLCHVLRQGDETSVDLLAVRNDLRGWCQKAILLAFATGATAFNEHRVHDPQLTIGEVDSRARRGIHVPARLQPICPPVHLLHCRCGHQACTRLHLVISRRVG